MVQTKHCTINDAGGELPYIYKKYGIVSIILLLELVHYEFHYLGFF